MVIFSCLFRNVATWPPVIQGSFKLSENGHHLLASSLSAQPSVDANLGNSDHGNSLYAVSPTTGACTVLSADSLQVRARFHAEKCETDEPLTNIFVCRSAASIPAVVCDYLVLTSPHAVFIATIPVIPSQTSSYQTSSACLHASADLISSAGVRTRRLDAALCFASNGSALTSAAWEPSAQCLAVGNASGNSSLCYSVVIMLHLAMCEIFVFNSRSA
jgi:hypothetical protein